MPRSDDHNGFLPGRRRRTHPVQDHPDWDTSERGPHDWRYPDPAERYGQEYDDQHGSAAPDFYADEWQTGSSDFEAFDLPADDRDVSGREPNAAWSDDPFAEDPFGWDAPEPVQDRGAAGVSDPAYTPGFDSETFASRDPWRAPDTSFDDAPRESAPRRTAARDDSLFRRIDGSEQEFDLSALTGRRAQQSDRLDPDTSRDPAELRDRFFSRTEPQHHEPQFSAPQANVFDFEAHRSDARQTQIDDPYSWDSYDDDPPMSAPPAAAPAHRSGYADGYDFYDGYEDDPHLQPEDELDADFLDDEPEAFEQPAPESGSRRKLMVAGVLVAAIATGGAAAFVYKSYQDGGLGSGETPTVLADEQPVKSKPSDPGGKEFPDGNKQIYDRLTGNSDSSTGGAGAGSEKSADTAAIPGMVTTGAEAPADTLDERIAAALRKSGANEGGEASANADPNAPRSVRTLTVRPDGSVVPSEGQVQSVPQTQAQSQPEPEAADTITTAGILAEADEGGTASEPAGQAATAASGSETQSAQTAQSAAPTPARAAPRPDNEQETRVASVEPETTSSTQPSATGSANPYFVQVAARRDQTSALAAFADLQQKYPNILDGLAPTIKRADLGDKGVWYRLWVGPMDDRSNASNVCGQLKQAGLGGCFVRTK